MTPAPEPPAQATAVAAPRRVPALAIMLLIATVALAIYIGTNVLGVLFAVVSPPTPPLPSGMDLVSYDSESYGVDLWKYTSAGDACAVVQYIQDNGGVCQVAPAQCSRDGDFSIFNMQWWALVMRLPNRLTQLELHREVFWIGTGPQ
jgi:hypothetical protein